MSAHLSNEIVGRFHSQSLTGGDRGEIYNHILGCETCRRRVVTPQVDAVAVQALTNHLLPQEDEAPYHLDPATIEAFVDDKLDALDRSTARLHLEDCAECTDEVNDLRESLATMRAASREREVERKPNAIEPRRPLMFSRSLRIAAMIALVAVTAVALIVAFRRSTRSPLSPDKRDITAGPQLTPKSSPQVPAFAPSPESISRSTNVASVTIKDGSNEITISQNGAVSGLPKLPDDSQRTVKEALSGEPLNRPDVLDEIATADVSERGPNSTEERIGISYPVRAIIQENRPTLRWKQSKTVEGYRVEIADESFHQVAKSEDLPATAQSWTPSAPLRRGETYTWTIRAVNKRGELSPVTSQAKFKVLDAQKVSELNQLRSSQSHLALGLFYAREGMIGEAEREFRILLKDNPDSSVAKKLLREVGAWRRR